MIQMQRARELRQELTEAEALLWAAIRNRQLAGMKFRRQHPVDRFVLDFYCAAAKLGIEVDGGIHNAQGPQDHVREAVLRARGIRILRVTNEAVLGDLELVLQRIVEGLERVQ
jgi:very-short-patch-repair endonuclease